MSRYHCLLQFKDNGDLFIYDLKSTHGTFLNKHAVEPFTYTKLRNGDTIKVGESSRQFIVNGLEENEDLETENVPIN